jgi:aminopyrrolnitrin oxygenase
MPVQQELARRAALNLAASWYIALPSRKLGARPRPLTLFGRPMVAWRGPAGRPSVMPKACPHMGASLASGRVLDGTLQCPFHHWRFDTTGACVQIPGSDRIPAAASRTAYPTVERYGYVWVWYGSSVPMFPLPELSALDRADKRYRRFRFEDTTAATVRRIMESTYDPDHLAELHGLGSPSLRMLQDVPPDHGSPIPAEAWLGAELEWLEYSRYVGRLGAITKLLGSNIGRFGLRVDGWPAGQRITYYADGVPQYRLLLAVTPIDTNRTVAHIAVAVERTGRFWRDLLHFLVNRFETNVASDQVLPIFNTIRPGDHHGIYVEGDHGVLTFRKYYQSWVDRVAEDA